MAELSNLKDYPGEIGCFEMAEFKADKQSTICIKNNHYSVPEEMAGENVVVKMYSNKIVILDKDHKVAGRHIRSYGSNEWIVDINHYVHTRRFDLVICDEMGYVSFDKEGAELLFNMISTRTGERATIITTNLPFTRWEEIIKDKVLCSALVDRLCHKARLVNMTGQSYRVRETQKMLKNLE